MFKGACRLDDPAHRTIIFSQAFQVKKFRLRSEAYPSTFSVVQTSFGGPFLLNAEKGSSTPDRT